MNPGTPSLLRGINDRAALDLLLEHGPLSRTQLGELTGLSKPTAGAAAHPARRRRAGDHQRQHPAAARGPRPALRGEPGRGATSPALDVTPTRVLAAVADIAGRTVGDYELRTPRKAGPDAVRRTCCTRSTVPPRRPGSTAAGCTGSPSARPVAFDPGTRQLRYARHLPGWHDPHLLDRLAEARRHRPSRSPTTSTWPPSPRCGRGWPRVSRTSSFCGRTKGLGAAVVIDGRVHGGATGGAGEVGFLPLPGTPLVRDVRRGNAGGFQELAGGRAVLALARSLGLRAEHAAGRGHQRRSTTPGAGRRAAGHARRAVRARHRRGGLRGRPVAGRPGRRPVHRRRHPAARPDRRRGRVAGADPPPPGARRRHRAPGARRRPAHRPRRDPQRGLRHHPTPHRRQPGPSPGENHEHDPLAAGWSQSRPPSRCPSRSAPAPAPPRAATATTRTRTSRSPSGTAGARTARSRRSSRRSTRSRTPTPTST